MGRTVKTSTQVINEQVTWWNKYRRALRRKDQMALDKLLSHAKKHFAALSYASNLNAVDVMIVSMLVEMQKELEMLRDEGCIHRRGNRAGVDNVVVEDGRWDDKGPRTLHCQSIRASKRQ